MKKYFRNIAVGGLVLLTGCNNFLDVVPDDRTEINTTEKLAKLVADAYPKASYAAMLNSRVDFVTDKGSGKQENNSNTDPFFWRDVEDETQDTPTWFWRKFYYSIAEVNHALKAAEEMGAPKEQEPYIAEAKMIRSFSHFMLVSLFAKFYDKDSDNSSPGVPYVTEPETVALAKYDRETVAKTYEKIEKDLIESIDKLGSDAIYTVPRYHFTRAAANAYASRFYLYKGNWGKVITYASKVFPMPSVFVGQEGAKNVSDRDNANIYAKNNFQPWLTTYAVAPGSSDVKIAYTKSDNTSNLLLTEMSSRMSRYANTWRYGCVKSDLEQTLTSSALNVTGGQWAYRNWYSGDNYYVPKYYDNGGINLIGNYNGRLARMDRATPEEAEKVVQGGLKKVIEHHDEFLNSNKFPTVEVDGKRYLMRPNFRKTEFAYVDEEGVLTELAVGSYLDFQGITQENAQSNVYFFEPAEINGMKVDGMKWIGNKYQVEINDKTYELVDNLVPPYPLNFGYNQTFSQLYMNPSAMVGTLTDPFMSEVYTPAYNRLNGRTRAIQEMYCKFVMNATIGKPVMELGITYLNTSTQKSFTAKWQYPYTLNEDGTITFTDREQTGSTNEFYYEMYMKELPDFFCSLEYSHYDTGESWANVEKSKIIPHTFKIDWAENKTQGLTGNIGGMFRADREEMYLAGQLKQ